MKRKLMLDLHLQIDAARLPLIVELLEGECRVVSVREAEAEAPLKKKRPNVHRGSKGNSAVDIVLRELGNGPRTYEALQQVLVKNGFSPVTVSPTTSTLRKTGYIQKSPKGLWALAKPPGDDPTPA